MFKSDPPAIEKEASTLRAILIGSAFALSGAAGIVFSGSLESEAWQWVVGSLSSIALSIGIVGLIYELAMRRTVRRELLALVGIEQSLANAQLERVGDASRIDWQEILSPASNIRVVAANPGGWVQENWNSIINGASDRPLEIEFFFSDPEGDWMETIAGFTEMEAPHLEESIRRASRIIEDGWQTASREGRLANNSRIVIRWINKFPVLPGFLWV